MIVLALIGAVVVTVALVWFILSYVAMLLLSDESFFFGWKHYRKEWVLGNLLFLVPICIGSWAWWIYIGSKITIGFG